MERNYDVQILDDPTSTKFLVQGYPKCGVVETIPPFRTRQFLYCMHCSKLGSSSWFFEHRKKTVFVLSTSIIENVRSSFSHYVNDSYSEVDYLFENGTLFKLEARRGQRTSKRTSRSERRSGVMDQTTRQNAHVPRILEMGQTFSMLMGIGKSQLVRPIRFHSMSMP